MKFIPDFIIKLFKFDADAKPIEKFLTVFFGIFVAVLLVILIGSAMGIGDNFIAQAAELASGFQKFMGYLLLIVAALWAWLNWSDRIPFKVNETLATLIFAGLFILSLLFFTGFYDSFYKF